MVDHESHATSRDEGWRGHVVVLFSDLCDYTRFSDGRDPEEVDALRRAVEQLTLPVVQKHAGAVTQVYGDGLLVVFGYPSPRENDARRALEAALEMHEAVRGASLDCASRHGGNFEPRLHTGIHSGLVFARHGDALHGRYELTGDAVNTAARLCAVAGRDEIVASATVLAGIEGFYATAAGAEQFLLKGKSSPVEAARVLGRSGVQTNFEARSRRGLTRFVGRTAELARLDEALEQTRSGQGRLLAVVAPGGMGKTRLLEELRSRWPGSDVTTLYGTCESYGDAAPLQPFSVLLRRLLGVTMGSGEHAAAESVAQALAQLGVRSDEALAHALARFCLGMPRPFGDHDGPSFLERSFTEMLDAACARGPVLVMLDDWQWADDASRSLFECLLRAISRRPLCVVLGTRAIDLTQSWVAQAELLHLLPFGEDESAEVIRELKPAWVDRGTLQAIHRHAGGHPLFLEELCRALPAVPHGEAVMLLPETRPSTVQAAIQARLALLPVAEADVLRAASVLGMEFSRALLERVAACEDLGPPLDRLIQEDLVYSVPGEDAYRFKHGITREVVYESVRVAERRRRHGAAALAITRMTPEERLVDHAEALALHHRGSGDHERTAFFAELAGNKALAASALDRARAHFETALSALDRLAATPERKQQWLQISTRWAMACTYNPARDHLPRLERTVAYADELGETGARAQARDALAWIHYVLGDYDQAREHYQAALALAEAADSPKLLAQLWANLGHTYAAAGQYDAALTLLTRSIDAKRNRAPRSEQSHPLGRAYSLACRASILAHRGDFHAAERDLAEARDKVRGSQQAIEGSVLALQAMVELQRGDHRGCVESATLSRAIAERVHSAYIYATATAFESYARYRLASERGELLRMDAAIQLLQKREQKLFLSFSHGCAADAWCRAGELAIARDYAERALARAESGDPLGAPAAHRVLARIGHAAGHDAGLIAREIDAALRAAEALGSPLERARTEQLAQKLLPLGAARDRFR